MEECLKTCLIQGCTTDEMAEHSELFMSAFHKGRRTGGDGRKYALKKLQKAHQER